MIFAAALAVLPSCAATKGSAIRSAAPRPTGVAPTITTVLAALDARDEALSRFRAQARLDYKSPQESFRSTQVVVVRAPSSARIDVMNPFGVSYTVTSDGTTIYAYDRRNRVYYQGGAQLDSFRKFIGIPLGGDELASILRGLPPALGRERWAAVEATEGGWRLRRRLGSGGMLQFVVDATTLVPRSLRIWDDPSRHEVEVTYDDFRDVDGVSVPHWIGADFKDGSHLELKYTSVQREVVLPESAFQLDPPKGARIVNIDSEGGGAR